jgi:hypothetical protein
MNVCYSSWTRVYIPTISVESLSCSIHRRILYINNGLETRYPGSLHYISENPLHILNGNFTINELAISTGSSVSHHKPHWKYNIINICRRVLNHSGDVHMGHSHKALISIKKGPGIQTHSAIKPLLFIWWPGRWYWWVGAGFHDCSSRGRNIVQWFITYGMC